MAFRGVLRQWPEETWYLLPPSWQSWGGLPVSSSLNLKAVAKAAGVKRAFMADGKVAERRTGYVLGGISPFGQSRSHRTFVDKIALSMDSIYVSAGKRGQEIRIVPYAFTVLLDASFVTLTNYD